MVWSAAVMVRLLGVILQEQYLARAMAMKTPCKQTGWWDTTRAGWREKMGVQSPAVTAISYSDAQVIGSGRVGGLVGANDGSIVA